MNEYAKREMELPVEEILIDVPEAEVFLELEAEDHGAVQSESSVGPDIQSPATTPSDIVRSDVAPRRSGRQRQPPQRFQYTALGNPLISVVQTLFHSLSNAYTEALGYAAAADTFSNL